MKTGKKLLSIVLCLVLFAGTIAIGGDGLFKTSAARITGYESGDIIELGSYPQSKVTDDDIISALDAVAGDNTTWTSYEYYSGTGSNSDGKMTASDYMRYKDVEYNGTKYRGVVFDTYRPKVTGSTPSDNYQEDNGYFAETVYWFKYEPIQWLVLDPATGLIVCESLIDSQAFNNYTVLAKGKYYGDSDTVYYANNYEKSSIREWLNNDFYNTAFSNEEKGKIETAKVDNSAITSEFSSANTNDKIFLLSISEVNATTCFDTNAKRQAAGTDYAKCQGISVNDEGYSNWRLRSASSSSNWTKYYDESGTYHDFCSTYDTYIGIRPALKLYFNYIIEFGSYPQSEVTDEDLVAALNGKVTDEDWISYEYYDALEKSDYMKYCDVDYKGEKYRGVYFETYRPSRTKDESSLDYYSTSQKFNGYLAGEKYWFKYEPLEWRVLDAEQGLILCENIIDTQQYYYNIDENRKIDGETIYPSNYEYSEIRAFMNDDFYNLAFTADEKEYITKSFLDNTSPYYSYCDSAPTLDNVFLLSYNDLINSDYGFSPNSNDYDMNRRASSSDYAKCQGVSIYSDYQTVSGEDTSNWLLRSPAANLNCCGVRYGNVVDMDSVYFTGNGVRPAIKVSNYESLGTKTTTNAITIDGEPVQKSKINVNGITLSKTVVEIYADGLKISETTSSAKGEWSFEGEIPNAENGNSYVLTAKVTVDGVEYISDELTIKYQQPIFFGSYPQSEATDWKLVKALNDKVTDEDWISYEYMSGTASFDDYDNWGNGSAQPSDYMQYCDVTIGNEKYRGVKFTKYRPFYNNLDNSNEEGDIYCQKDNGYYTNTTYWFKYEPLEWRVLDAETGLVMCENIIDSQAYSNTFYEFGEDSDGYETCWKDSEHTIFANDYANSSIREWLNEDFYNTAFNEEEKALILDTTLDNSAYEDSTYDSEETCDKVFLLSFDDATNSDYGFSSDPWDVDINRLAQGSDYAKCQGLWSTGPYSDTDTSGWWLRTPGYYSFDTSTVYEEYGFIDSVDVFDTEVGVRPAITLHIHSYDEGTVVNATCTEQGYTLYTCDCGDTYKDNYTDMLEHKPVVDNAVAPTCTATGLTEGKHCDACNTVIVAQEEVPATGHKDTKKDGICETCKVVINEELNKKYLVSKATINAPSGKTVDYRNKVKLTATAANVPSGYYVQIFEGTKAVGEKGAANATYTSGELKAGVTYTVKIVDAKGNVVSSDAQNKTVKVDVNAGFFKKLVAFFKGLFGTLPTINL